jgi:3-deoxy-manno-octulosonate cytidylyltransferase (CMP-KDO synthetase)
MKTLAVIPARLGATRLPRKPLCLVAGVPLVLRVWERVMAMRVADECVIATDAEAVASVAREGGATVMITSPEHPSGTDRVAEVITDRRYRDFGVIVNVQGDEPFMPADAVRGAAGLVTGGRFELGTAAIAASAEILQSPNVVKVVSADDGRAMYFSRAPIPFLRDPSDRETQVPLVRQHIGIYAYSREALEQWVALPTHPLERVERLEQLRPLAAGIPMGVAVIGGAPPVGIDTEEDLAHANERWSAFVSENRP